MGGILDTDRFCYVVRNGTGKCDGVQDFSVGDVIRDIR